MTNFVNNFLIMALRLIDANALIEMLDKMKIPVTWLGFTLESQHNQSIRDAIYAVNSLPTVETTDDVLTRIGRHPTVFFGNDEWNAYVMQNLNKVCNWKTPLEAVTRLEATLRA